MKKITLLMAAAIGALSMTAPAMAESDAPSEKPRQISTSDDGKGKGKRVHLFQMMDLNEDGSLVIAEVTAFHTKNIDKMFENFDTNTNDVLDGKEAAKAVTMMDTDNDGLVTRNEAVARSIARATNMFEKIDLDGDDKVTVEEFHDSRPKKPRGQMDEDRKPQLRGNGDRQKPAKGEMRTIGDDNDGVKDRKKGQ